MSKLAYLVSELRRRKVFGVAAAYAFVAWGVIQFSGTVLQMASAPAWIAKAVLAVVVIGFPIALVLAWFFDISSTGFVRTASLDASEQAHHATSRFSLSHIFVAIGVLITAGLLMAFAVWLRPDSDKEVEFTQLTNFADAVTAPALSPDGKMVAFVKGGGAFGNSVVAGQLYIKQLPDGEAVQLTNTPIGKATPAFTPDGSRVTFTSADPKFRWSTHVVSINGGSVTELLPNASGLIWLDSVHVMYSVTKTGAHMGVRRSTITRDDVHDVYWPTVDQAMAHRSAVSPDRRWILLAEMEAGAWQQCRLMPFDASSTGRKVGPVGGQCTYAAWSPDGKWMYFSSSAGGAFHLWRQRFPKGEPEQLTHGPTEEEGIAVAPDGRSLITSAGVRQNSIWLLDPDGGKQISVEEYAFCPVASRDGTRLYFLSRTGTARREASVGKLIVTALNGGTRQQLLPGQSMVHFDLSADDSLIVFVSGNDAEAQQGIWLAPLDRSAAPRRVFAGQTDRAFFDAAGNIYFLTLDGAQRRVHRLLAPDYRLNEVVYAGGVQIIFRISPDGEWLVVAAPPERDEGIRELALSTRGGQPRVICGFCAGGAGPARALAPPLSWTRDGRTLLASAQYVSPEYWMGPANTIAIPVRPGAQLPQLPSTGIASVQDYLKQPGARTIPKKQVLPGATGDQMFFYEPTTIRNLYRVKLP